jgi:predicted nucleic-acid-binding Zn-ribbon protein
MRIDTCPKCGSNEIHQDEADVGVGIIYGPAACADCGWDQEKESKQVRIKGESDAKRNR